MYCVQTREAVHWFPMLASASDTVSAALAKCQEIFPANRRVFLLHGLSVLPHPDAARDYTLTRLAQHPVRFLVLPEKPAAATGPVLYVWAWPSPTERASFLATNSYYASVVLQHVFGVPDADAIVCSASDGTRGSAATLFAVISGKLGEDGVVNVALPPAAARRVVYPLIGPPSTTASDHCEVEMLLEQSVDYFQTRPDLTQTHHVVALFANKGQFPRVPLIRGPVYADMLPPSVTADPSRTGTFGVKWVAKWWYPRIPLADIGNPETEYEFDYDDLMRLAVERDVVIKDGERRTVLEVFDTGPDNPVVFPVDLAVAKFEYTSVYVVHYFLPETRTWSSVKVKALGYKHLYQEARKVFGCGDADLWLFVKAAATKPPTAYRFALSCPGLDLSVPVRHLRLLTDEETATFVAPVVRTMTWGGTARRRHRAWRP